MSDSDTMSTDSDGSDASSVTVAADNSIISPSVTLASAGIVGAANGPYPRAHLACRPNSHPFQDRNLALDQPCKVGRSVARARPGTSNAIFDCKVLSRNHALIWYEGGKFFLQDTKSSNGTFVNNQRLSKGSEESLPREVCSGDILQFGVDVMENSRKVTHGCIIATLRLFLPDGKEAKASPTIIMSSNGNSNQLGNLPPQDLYLLNQYIQEALAREQLLETKLAVLQRLVGQTEVASNNAWKSLIDEDRLLTRVEILESQLLAYSKCMTEDKLRDEAHRLMEEKEEYQEVAKETLRKLAGDKLEAVKRSRELEKQLSCSEDELGVLRELYENCAEENRRLAEEMGRMMSEEKKSKEEEEQQQQQKEEEEKVAQELQKEKEEEEGGNEEEQPKITPSDLEHKLEEQAREFGVKFENMEREKRELQSQLDELLKHKEEEVDASAVTQAVQTIGSINTITNSSETEEKLMQLLKVKEKYCEVSQANSVLESSLLELEAEMETLTFQSQTATACSLIPLAVLLVAIMVAYLPMLSALFGTAEV